MLRHAMRVPHADHAIIPASKLRNYLLSRRHPVAFTRRRFSTAWGIPVETGALFGWRSGNI